MLDLPDEQLIASWRAEKETAKGRSLLDELFERHRTRVATWCFRITGEVDTASDLAQDVLFKAFQRLDSFRSDAKFTTWLYTITRNHCMDQLRSRSAQPNHAGDALLEEMPDGRLEEISVTLERRESDALVRQLIRESLDETEGKVMTLHYVDELPLEAITRLMGLTNLSGAKGYIVSARRKLSRAVAKWRQAQASRRGRYEA